MSIKQTYNRKDHISHILDRSETYVGSKELDKKEDYIAIKDLEENIFSIKKKYIVYSPAILRMFIEILSNAIDNIERSKNTKTPCSMIKININKETGEISIWNDGLVIPIEKWDDGTEQSKKENIYNHTLIFGHLMSGSNYNDKEKRLVSGTNGLGAKLVNVFSKKFTVKGLDPVTKQVFEQIWKNNMRETDGPKITKTKLTKGFTKITYFLDFKRFSLDGYTDDIINLYTKYIIDSAMLSNTISKVKVYLNEELIPITDLLSYSQLYESLTNERLLFKSKDSQVVITPCNVNEFQQISFANGIHTIKGGIHVDLWTEAIFRPLVDKFNGKKGKKNINIGDVKQFFRIFVITTIENPVFEGQSKEELRGPKGKIKPEVTQTDINKIWKWSVIEDIQDIISMKDMVVLKKLERKKNTHVKIENLEPANKAGGKDSEHCSLILCEGDSAKTYGTVGIQKGVFGKASQDWFGIYKLGGVILNTRNKKGETIAKSKAVDGIIKSLNLKQGLDYTEEKNYKTLHYGKVILLTDADFDGLHISGLVLNLFESLFPSLLQRKEPYVVNMCTPIVRVMGKGKEEDILYYDENKYNTDYEEAKKKGKILKHKYYKGLAAIPKKEIAGTFGEKMINFYADEDCNKNMVKVFHNKFADLRKEWIATHYPPNPKYSLDDKEEIMDMSISSFLNNEVIKFSHNDCKRSIPSLFDGLKESQRKILYCFKKRGLTYNKDYVKVEQLSGYVAEHSKYHHGQEILQGTMTKMAQSFVGSNNIPLFYREGAFGSRLQGGKDAGAGRYISTKMESITPYIFREEDDILLEYLDDDGYQIEPKFYIPILPMILVNGCTGIGTGWSCTVPSFNPLDIIECIKIWLENDGEILLTDPDSQTIVSMLPELKPWYRGFNGKIEKTGDRFTSYGIINRDKKNEDKVYVSELPIGMWTDKFKDTCDGWLEKKND
jgi:DNA topoisomerase II